LAIELDLRITFQRSAFEHEGAGCDHDPGEQRQKLLAVEHLAQGRTDQRADNTSHREHQGAAPLHDARVGVLQEVRGSVHGDGECARADGDVGVGHADHIDQQGNGENRTTAADDTE
jgi:hypothetical protein